MATRKKIAVYFTEDEQHYMTILIYIPNKRNGAVPMFFGLNFKGNHTICDDPDITESITRMKPREGNDEKRPGAFKRGVASSRWPVEMLIANGYALATVYRGDIDPDYDDNFKNGVHPLFYKEGQTKPSADEWGTLSAWAWGLSCAMDYFETDEDINSQKVAVVGHSRHGKTALWAGAIDQRFAMAISNNSGCGGAALSRRKVYIASAVEDKWADPKGEFLSGVFATPVYELFSLEGLNSASLPEVDQPLLSGSIGYHLRSGDHDIKLYDWQQFVKFADKHFK